MRILCRHGHLAFFPRLASDMARFSQYFNVTLERVGDFYTFPTLVEAPDFSIKGLPWLGQIARETYEGHPWEVMRENGFVYNIKTEGISLKESILEPISFPLSRFCYIMPVPLVQPGTRNSAGQQVLSYDGEYDPERFLLKISEVTYE